MVSHPDYKFILLGDFNCNLHNDSHPFTPIIQSLMSRRNLTCSFDLHGNFDPNNSFTRSSSGVNGPVFFLLDFILISSEMADCVKSVSINHFSDNLSDHLPVTVDFEFFLSDIVRIKPQYRPAIINWNSVNEEVRLRYSEKMEQNLRAIDIPFHELLHGNFCCNNNNHMLAIEKYFNDIISAISDADKCIPRSRPGVSKDFWNEVLTNLKKASHDAFLMWRDSGRPPSGEIFNLKKETHYRYKYAVKRAKKLFDQERSDSIHESLIGGNGRNFWNKWQNIHGKTDNGSTRINGKMDDTDIANEFATNFKKIYDEANSDRTRQLSREFSTAYSCYVNDHAYDDVSQHYLSWDNMVEVMSKLKAGKASGSFIKPEHILYGSPQLVVHLHLLFNSLIQHGYVPSEFLQGVISPIIKDPEGDASSVDNYRGITLSHVFSFLFEHAVLLRLVVYFHLTTYNLAIRSAILLVMQSIL